MGKVFDSYGTLRILLSVTSVLMLGSSCSFLGHPPGPLAQSGNDLANPKPSPTSTSDGNKNVGVGLNNKPSGLGSVSSIAASIATAGFQYIATQALEQECDQGQAAACKIAYALDPNYKIGVTLKQINDTLNNIDEQLGLIAQRTQAIETSLDNLASQLGIAVADIKLDIANENLKNYILEVVIAYNRLLELDYTDNKAVDTLQYLRSVFTNDEYFVSHKLDIVHGLIVDDLDGPGLLSKMSDKIAQQVDSIWKNRPPSAEEAINFYIVLEDYFGHLLTQQEKGLVVMSAAYKALDELEQNPGSNQQAARDLRARLAYKTFDDFKAHYNKQIEKQIQTFLFYVEKYIGYTANVDKPGSDGSDTDLDNWISPVLKRSDSLATWVRLTLTSSVPIPLPSPTPKPSSALVTATPTPSPSPSSIPTPVMLVVHVVSEPDRFNLLNTVGKVQLGNQTPSLNFTMDKGFLNQLGQSGTYRTWPTRKPYVQFPLHPELAHGTVQREGAIKGASSLMMNSYILTEKDGLKLNDGDKKQVVVNLGNELNMNPLNVLADMEVKLIGPDGSPPKAGDAAIYFGHTTLILKETAARLGQWSHSNPGNLKNDSIDNLKTEAQISDTFPQSGQLYVYADPHTWSKSTCENITGACKTYYYAKGHGYYHEQLKGEYYFEGWGDVPLTNRGKVSSVLSGTKTDNVEMKAKNGSYSMELQLGVNNTSQTLWGSTTATGSMNVPVSSTFPGNGPITYYIEPRIKLDWDTSREGGPSYSGSTYKGTLKFDLSSLVLQVLPPSSL